MFNRIQFFESVQGIDYPEMMINFFDHFLALKNLIENEGMIKVEYSTPDSIGFSVEFSDPDNTAKVVNYVTHNPRILIYGRFINVTTNILTDKKIEIILN